jgi:hypothetical protein
VQAKGRRQSNVSNQLFSTREREGWLSVKWRWVSNTTAMNGLCQATVNDLLQTIL